jgi:hypothetical protein
MGLAVGVSVLMVGGVLGVSALGSPDALAGAGCSSWRSDVKTLSDPDRRDVNFHARRTSVRALRRVDPPAALTATTPRLGGMESRVHQVRAQVVEARTKRDGTIHLVIAQRNDRNDTMIVQFPADRCVDSSFRRPEMRRARERLLDACGRIGSRYTELTGDVVVRGVGFWDEARGQRGVAPNGLELHPVLSFRGSCTAGSPSPGDGPIPPIESLRPIRDPADSASESYYQVEFLNFDFSEGERVIERLQFETGEGWEFYDRWHYSCVTMYLQAGDERVARLVVRTPEGVAYAGLNDRFGNEQPLGNSQCGIPNKPEGEIEEKPAGLQNSRVSFRVDGQVVSSLVFPATSSLDPDTWFELEEHQVGPNHVVVEAYWEDELIARIDIHRMTADVSITAS